MRIEFGIQDLILDHCGLEDEVIHKQWLYRKQTTQLIHNDNSVPIYLTIGY